MVSSGLRPELENFTRCLVGSASEVSALMLVNLAGRRGLNCKDDERMKSCRSVIAQCWDTSPPTHCQEIIPCSLLRSQPQQRCLLESTKNLRSIIEENWQFFYWTLLKFPFLTPEFVGGRQVGEQRSLILFPAGGDVGGGGGRGRGGIKQTGKRENLPLDWSRDRGVTSERTWDFHDWSHHHHTNTLLYSPLERSTGLNIYFYRNCPFTKIDEITYIIYLKISILLTFSRNLLSRKLWSCYRLVQLLTNIFQEMIIVLSVRENYNYSQNPHISHIVTVGRAQLSEGSKIGLTETRSDQIWAQEEITLSEGISQPSIQFVKTPSSLPPPEILSDIFCWARQVLVLS